MLMCETKGSMRTGMCNLEKAVIFRLFTPKGLIFIFIFCKIGNHIHIEGKWLIEIGAPKEDEGKS